MGMEKKMMMMLLFFVLFQSYGVKAWTGEIRGRVVCDVCGDSSLGPEDHVLEGPRDLRLKDKGKEKVQEVEKEKEDTSEDDDDDGVESEEDVSSMDDD
ncbi:hypothetical protein IFM89_012511 [Coptis chinensis]|uniref:Uncharacterized protein n=1 Tax=Coptis chinensis TaxID=261450 RepID=A0A835M378_9MAGN|nr:hypothetical protein IFM89_012511 [Coptis chinensis]